jgi:hypothetical protein
LLEGNVAEEFFVLVFRSGKTEAAAVERIGAREK